MGRQEEDTARYDQPDPIDGTLWDPEDEEPNDTSLHAALQKAQQPKLTKRARKRVAHFEAMDYEVTPAQRLMREEMGNVVPARVALEEVVPSSVSHPLVEQIALDIINENGGQLRGSFQEWAIIQHLIELGIQKGVRLGQGAAG